MMDDHLREHWCVTPIPKTQQHSDKHCAQSHERNGHETQNGAALLLGQGHHRHRRRCTAICVPALDWCLWHGVRARSGIWHHRAWCGCLRQSQRSVQICFTLCQASSGVCEAALEAILLTLQGQSQSCGSCGTCSTCESEREPLQGDGEGSTVIPWRREAILYKDATKAGRCSAAAAAAAGASRSNWRKSRMQSASAATTVPPPPPPLFRPLGMVVRVEASDSPGTGLLCKSRRNTRTSWNVVPVTQVSAATRNWMWDS